MNLEKFITHINSIKNENKMLKKENELLKEELKDIKASIDGVYNNMISLDIIYKKELEDIEEL